MENKINNICNQIKIYFKSTNAEKAVIGISGGKDSTVAAALCAKAIGKENVIGVMMPNGIQTDIVDSIIVCNFLGIKHVECNIQDAYNDIMFLTKEALTNIDKTQISNQTKFNLAPRLRMSMLYAIAQSINGRVINTSNACELFVGYGTLFGDTAGDLALFKNIKVSDIYKIGDALGLPYDLVHKTPSDGLTGKSDEDVLGVTYNDIEIYMDGYLSLLTQEKRDRINSLYENSRFKRQMISLPTINF